MMMTENRVIYKPQAKKFLKRIREKTLKQRLKDAIDEITIDPHGVGDPKKGDLQGVYGYDVHYQKTNYEIAYKIERDQEGNVIIIILAGTRENFYNELKRNL